MDYFDDWNNVKNFFMGLRVHPVVPEVDGGHVHRDIDCSSTRLPVENGHAFGVIDLASPDRHTSKVVSLERRKRVAGIEYVSDWVRARNRSENPGRKTDRNLAEK